MIAMIDLDANATTPLSQHARDAIAAAMADLLGNPSSLHGRGQAARARVEQARKTVMTAVGGAAGKIVWTSGATEANALAWHGVLADKQQPRVVTSPVEHPSIRGQVARLRQQGVEVVDVPVDAQGRLDLAAYESALRQPTTLVSVMAVQNELGLVYPTQDLARMAHAAGALFHCDATQAPGRIPLDLQALDVDLASLSAHKAGGPSGVGALWLKRGQRLQGLIPGHQEDGLRGGTENVLGIVGMAAAFGDLPERLAQMPRLRMLRDRLWQGVQAIADVRRNGAVEADQETGHVLNVGWPNVDGARLVRALDLEGVCAASGAACASGTQEPSHVLLACGQTSSQAREGLRLSLGPHNTDADIAALLALLPRLVARVRQP
jgi:cysteine desulfurase